MAGPWSDIWPYAHTVKAVSFRGKPQTSSFDVDAAYE